MTRVYVESNFLLELVLQQEEAEACEQLLACVAERSVELVVPAFCLVEPESTLRHRIKELREFSSGLERELRELGRRCDHGLDLDLFVPLVAKWRSSLNETSERLTTVRTRLASAGKVLPLTWEVLERATELRAEGVLKGEPDALVLASIVLDLEARPTALSLFANRNSKDFLSTKPTLRPLNCHLLTQFRDVVARVKSLPT